ncbi:MAG: rod shape-determining protein MreC [FCB group bacterium]|nr:rod shape-determining protein MreC [FCB group bacterium]
MVHLVTIVILSFILIVGHNVINPYLDQVVLSVFYYPFAKVKNSFVELRAVASKNEILRQKLVYASVTISKYEEASRENKRLRSVLGFKPPFGYSLLPAEIISIGGEHIPVSAVLNKGADDSVFVEQPVINQQGLIGKISMVSKDFATVQLLTDPSNRVAARLAVSREMGIIKYTLAKGMILDNFPNNGHISVGDTILSSGLGGVYPSGLFIGTVKEVNHPEYEPFCKVKVEPAANFHALDELFVLKKEK